MRTGSLLVASLALAAAAAGAVVALDRAGTKSRSMGQARPLSGALQPLVVSDARDLFSAWKTAGARGRTVVHVGAHLHLVPATEEIADEAPLAVPGTGALFAEYEHRLDGHNFLWVAIRTGLARRLFLVVPEMVFRKKHHEADLGGVEDRFDLLGTPIVVAAGLPAVREPVLLVVDASWFDVADGEALLAQVRRSGLTSDLVAVRLADDASAAARVRTLAFARALASGAAP